MKFTLNMPGLALSLVILASLTSCFEPTSQSSAAKEKSPIAPEQANILSLAVPMAVSNVSGMTATLDILGVGSYPMTVNADKTVSVTVPGIPIGQHTFTITFYSNSIVVAKTETTAQIQTKQTTQVAFADKDLDRNFDDDSDGWVNLTEILWGSDPQVVTDFPPYLSSDHVIATVGGRTASTTYQFSDTLGEGYTGGASTSSSYSVTSGFSAYPNQNNP